MAWTSFDQSGSKLTRALSDLPVATIVGTGAASAPTGWLLCDGASVSRASYPELFAAVGTTYGVGDGSTTFGVPNADGQMIFAVSLAQRLGASPDGQYIYATEALRDAAIPAPVEGQRAYVTASTVAAATGATTMVPTGIQTIYNGAAWVCVTEIGSLTSTDGSTTSASYTTTLTSGGTNPSVTLLTGTTALVTFAGDVYNTLGGSGKSNNVTVSVSGATTIAAISVAEANTLSSVAGNATGFGRSVLVSGLTAGANTFTLNYLVSGGGTGNFRNRYLTARGIA